MQRYLDLSHKIKDPIKGLIPTHLAFADLLYAGGVMFHQVSGPEEGRLDLISYVYFDEIRHWELIAWYNGIRDALREIEVGKILAIPVDPVIVNNLISSNVRSFTYLEIT